MSAGRCLQCVTKVLRWGSWQEATGNIAALCSGQCGLLCGGSQLSSGQTRVVANVDGTDMAAMEMSFLRVAALEMRVRLQTLVSLSGERYFRFVGIRIAF